MSIHLEREHFIEPHSYVVFYDEEDGLYKAKNGLTKAIDYSDVIGSTVIQETIDTLFNGGIGWYGGSVFLRGGNYGVSTALLMRSRVSLIGESILKTRLCGANANVNIIDLGSGGDGRTITNLDISGKDKTGTGSGIIGVPATHDVLSNLYVWNHGYDGLRLSLGSSWKASRIRSNANGRHGLYILGAGGYNAIKIHGTFNNNGQQGVRLAEGEGDGAELYIIAEGNGNQGVYAYGLKGALIKGFFDGNVDTGVFLEQSDGNVLILRMTNLADVDGVRVYSGYNNVILGGYYTDYNVGGTHIRLDSGAYYTTIVNPRHSGTGNKIVDNGVQTRIISGDYKNSGTATILDTETTVVFAHGLAGTPTLVILGATHAEVADAIWSADDTNITITVAGAVTANRNISWYAEYKP